MGLHSVKHRTHSTTWIQKPREDKLDGQVDSSNCLTQVHLQAVASHAPFLFHWRTLSQCLHSWLVYGRYEDSQFTTVKSWFRNSYVSWGLKWKSKNELPSGPPLSSPSVKCIILQERAPRPSKVQGQSPSDDPAYSKERPGKGRGVYTARETPSKEWQQFPESQNIYSQSDFPSLNYQPDMNRDLTQLWETVRIKKNVIVHTWKDVWFV